MFEINDVVLYRIVLRRILFVNYYAPLAGMQHLVDLVSSGAFGSTPGLLVKVLRIYSGHWDVITTPEVDQSLPTITIFLCCAMSTNNLCISLPAIANPSIEVHHQNVI